jgi:hypothetical protein
MKQNMPRLTGLETVLIVVSTKIPLLRSLTMPCVPKPRLPIPRHRAIPDHKNVAELLRQHGGPE